MSIAGNSGIQIAVKRGFRIWEVPRLHPYWKNRRLAILSMGYSRNNSNSFTLALVGTTSDSQTTLHTFCQSGLKNREAVASNVLTEFYKSWLRKY